MDKVILGQHVAFKRFDDIPQDSKNKIPKKKIYAIHITLNQTDGGFTGPCDILNAFSSGESYGDTMENIKEAVTPAAKASGNPTNFDLLVIHK